MRRLSPPPPAAVSTRRSRVGLRIVVALTLAWRTDGVASSAACAAEAAPRELTGSVGEAESPPASEPLVEEVPSLLQQLGDDRYAVRERAEQRLIRLGPAAFDLLKQAIEMVRYDSASVYHAIEQENPFAAEVRQRFFALADEVRTELDQPVLVSQSPTERLDVRAPTGSDYVESA